MELIKGPEKKTPLISSEYEQLLTHCMEKMNSFIEECMDEDAFDDLKSDFVDEILNLTK